MAVRNTRIAQGVTAALVLLGGTLAVIGMPGQRTPTSPPKSVELPEVVLPADPGKGVRTLTPVDYSAVSSRLGLVKNAPKIEAAAPTPGDGGTPPPPPPPPPPSLRYLGMANMGSLRLALVHDGVKQRFVAVGAKLGDGTTVKAIEADRLIVQGLDGEHVIELAARSGETFTKASPSRMQGGPPGGGPGYANMPAGAGAAHSGTAPNAASNVAAMQAGAFRSAAGGVNSGKVDPRAAAMAAMKDRKYTKDANGVVRDAMGNDVKDAVSVRAQELRDKLKASGRYQNNDELDTALKEILEREGEDGKGGGPK